MDNIISELIKRLTKTHQTYDRVLANAQNSLTNRIVSCRCTLSNPDDDEPCANCQQDNKLFDDIKALRDE